MPAGAQLREVKAGSSVDSPMFPVGAEDLPTIYGPRGYLAGAIAAGTAYLCSPASCYVVNRTQQFDVEIDRVRLVRHRPVGRCD